MTDEHVIEELSAYLRDAKGIEHLREGLQFVVWLYIEENIDTGLDRRINGVFLTDFNSLIAVLSMLQYVEK
jgi:hypothetical protein